MPRQITNLATEAGGVLISPDGKNLVFTSDVFPPCGADNACNQKELDNEKNGKVKARIYTELLYRHWNRWGTARRSHLMTIGIAGGDVKDLTPGTRDVPPFSLGGGDDYAISPDGSEVCYAMNADPTPATSTNADLYVVSMAGGPARKITTNPGADSTPLYSPDGKYLAWRAQVRPGYESDRWRLWVMERLTGRVADLSENMDRWVNGFIWSPDSANLFYTSEDRGRQSIQFKSVRGGEAHVALSGDNHLDEMQFTPDGKTLIYTQQSGAAACRDLPRIFERRSGAGVNAPQRRCAQLPPNDAARGVLGGWRGRRARAELRGQAVRFSGRPKVSGADADSRRAAGRMGT